MIEKKVNTDTEVTLYVAFDGVEFLNSEMCKKYESNLGFYLFEKLKKNGSIKILWNNEMWHQLKDLSSKEKDLSESERILKEELLSKRNLSCEFSEIVREYGDSSVNIMIMEPKTESELNMMRVLVKTSSSDMGIFDQEMIWYEPYKSIENLELCTRSVLYTEVGNDYTAVYGIDKIMKRTTEICEEMYRV